MMCDNRAAVSVKLRVSVLRGPAAASGRAHFFSRSFFQYVPGACISWLFAPDVGSSGVPAGRRERAW